MVEDAYVRSAHQVSAQNLLKKDIAHSLNIYFKTYDKGAKYLELSLHMLVSGYAPNKTSKCTKNYQY